MIRLGAIDDDRLLLDCFRSRLADVDDFVLAGCADTVDAFLAARPAADVVMLDLRLADGSAPASNVTRLGEAGYRVCMVSTHHDQAAAQATLRAGAKGYVTKDHDVPRLLAALRAVAEGHTADSPELAFTLMQDRDPMRPEFSEQQRRLLVALSTGRTLTAIARQLDIKPGTAKTYLDRIKQKYEEVGRRAQTRVELAQRAREDGLID